ncbi:MAG TPA: transporter, partial [Rhodobacteraceae bacterium]|nr:transporter [Paracoccaceae bacterium]
DTNRRVYEALALYVLAQEAREKAGLSAAALKDMGRFAYIMEQRVNGGISDTSDLNILRQKLAEIRSSEQMSRETAETSFAELNAMSVKKLDGVSGLSAVSVDPAGARPLAVVLAEAEKERSVAGAQAERAGHMPVICAQVIGGTGGVSAGVTAVTAKPLGFGTGASLKAIEAATEAATRRVAQADEDARRDIARLMQEAQGLDRQGMEAQALTAQAKANLDLFQEQYDA